MLNLLLTAPILVADVLQIDYAYFIIWWIAPIVVLFGRLAVAVYRTRRKRNELRRIEEKSTPFTRQS